VATAVWFPHARAVEIRDEPVPEPGLEDVRVRAVLSALSQGTERLVYRGEVDESLPLDLPTLAGSYGFPVKFGYASVGRVTGTGRDVRGIGEGDLVFALHPHQSDYVVPASLVHHLPDGITPDQGVFLANLDTAVNVVLDAHPRFGETVAVFGQGVVGLLVTQVVRRAGAQVIAIDPSQIRRDTAERCGAQTILATGDATLLHALTAGRGVDLAIEASGNAQALQQAIDAVAAEGTVVVCSWYGDKPVTLDLGGNFHRGRVRIVSSQVGRLGPALTPRWDRDRRLAVAMDLLPDLVVSDLITHRIPFAHAAEAYDILDRGSDETVQVVLTYD
jgi:2-desacetyl-2-hydroxyethyl bacteriochlorophyllide A dehydrogenase